MPFISLCMIVKNEEEQLPHCLKSVQGLVDEIIVVDTGSTDRTVEMAVSFGAQVFPFVWIDDFSAARNESLRHAKGDWILYLDADERLECPSWEDCLRKAASVPGVDAYSFAIKNFKPGGDPHDFELIYNIRFFRKIEGIRFVNEVHERVEPFLAEIGATTVRSPIQIAHMGYRVHPLHMEQKLLRNLVLSQKHLARDPEDPYALYYLGITALLLERTAEGRLAFEKALRVKDLPLYLKSMLLNLLAYLDLNDGQYRSTLARANESLTTTPCQNSARLLMGLAYFQLQDYRSALPLIFKAYQFIRLPLEKRHTELSQEYSFIDENELNRVLGMTYASLGELPQAISFFRRYLAVKREDPDILRRLGLCYLNMENFDSAIEYLNLAKEQGIDENLLALPMAHAHSQLGDLEQAQTWLREASPQNAAESQLQSRIAEQIGLAQGRSIRPKESLLPTVSLCMIVKNEEKHLPSCLAGVASLVDEMVVVDTGSSDRTVEIARSFGACVHFFPWIDDFAAARNESLRHAQGDWILYLDADEQINCLGEDDCLRKAAATPGVDGFSLPIRNRKKDWSEHESHIAHALRLFRNYPGIRFVGKVHERVEDFFFQRGANIVRGRIFIEHFGYDVDPSQVDQKYLRNLQLLRRQVQDHPDDAYSHYHLGLTLKGLRREEESRKAFQQALSIPVLDPCLKAMILNMVAHHHLSMGEHLHASRAAEESLTLIPRQNLGRLLLGLALYHIADYADAYPFLIQAYEFVTLPPEERLTDVHYEDTIEKSELLKALCICCMETRRFQEAASYKQQLEDTLS